MNNVINPYFSEDSYKGQDVVHQGIRIPLNESSKAIKKKFSPKARQRCKPHESVSFQPLRKGHLEKLRKIWFDENDQTFPTDIEDRVGWAARIDGELEGAIILSPSGRNLFMHQLVSSEVGKKWGLPTRLIWYAVQMLANTGWHSIDVGVSYNPKRYSFFKQFAVETYPIILKKPFHVPVIRMSPFRGFGCDTFSEKWLQDDVASTLLPRGSYALLAILKHLGIKEHESVNIVKTFGSDYITRCVTDTIEKTGAKWDLRGPMHVGTKAVLVIHEFGIPVYQDRDLAMIQNARNLGIPIIEDCAWRLNRHFFFSDYWFFSAQKMFDLNYGAVLRGVHIPDDKLWEYGCLDFVKRDKLANGTRACDVGVDRRVENWRLFHELVLADGMTPDECYDYEKSVRDNVWVPTVYLLKVDSDKVADELVARLVEFGVQAGHYHGEPVIFVPIHQSMTRKEVEYVFAVIKGYYNLCHAYV
jgi:hypothetical protein